METKASNPTLSKLDKPEEYWDELSRFRNSNKNDCISSKPIGFDGTMSSFYEYDSRYLMGSTAADKMYHHTHNQHRHYNDLMDNNNDGENYDDFDGRNHKCIHSYTLNERLFPVPVCKGKNGLSTCPVCKATRREGNSFIPQFCKISIPKSYVQVKKMNK
jgi:hypothetical protein